MFCSMTISVVQLIIICLSLIFPLLSSEGAGELNLEEKAEDEVAMVLVTDFRLFDTGLNLRAVHSDEPMVARSWIGSLADRFRLNSWEQRKLRNHMILVHNQARTPPPDQISSDRPIRILHLENENGNKKHKWNDPKFRLWEKDEWTAGCSVPCQVVYDQSQWKEVHILVSSGYQVPNVMTQTNAWQRNVIFLSEPEISSGNNFQNISSSYELVSTNRFSQVRFNYAFDYLNILPPALPDSFGPFPSLLYNYDLPTRQYFEYDSDNLNSKVQVAAYVNGCDFIPSNFFSSASESYQSRYLIELMNLMPIDSYGPCENTKSIPNGQSLTEVMSKYLFVLYFDEHIIDDYVSPIFYQLLASQSILVYMGAPNISHYLPDLLSILSAQENSPKSMTSKNELRKNNKNVNRAADGIDGCSGQRCKIKKATGRNESGDQKVKEKVGEFSSTRDGNENENEKNKFRNFQLEDAKIIIETNHHPQPKDLAAHLNKIASTPELYEAHVAWRSIIKSSDFPLYGSGFGEKGADSIACRLCEYYTTNMKSEPNAFHDTEMELL